MGEADALVSLPCYGVMCCAYPSFSVFFVFSPVNKRSDASAIIATIDLHDSVCAGRLS